MQKKDNRYLLNRQLEMLKEFLSHGVITKAQYDYEEQILTSKIKIETESKSNDNSVESSSDKS